MFGKLLDRACVEESADTYIDLGEVAMHHNAELGCSMVVTADGRRDAGGAVELS